MGCSARNYFANFLKFQHGVFFFILCTQQMIAAQRPPYSLQAAVDELHRREAAKYPLNAPPSPQHFFTGLGASSDLDYWDDDSYAYPGSANSKNRNRHKLNREFAKYLERENYEADHGGLSLGPFGGYEFDEDNNHFFTDEKKRSSYFRERDTDYDKLPASVFRERESTPSSGSELKEQFLHEIEEAQQREREERYKDALRQLWEKYQDKDQDANEVYEEKSKRMRIPPYYMLMQKKRSYPVLPWLPYTERKKRFPVSKRSTKRTPNDNANLFKTDENVAKELSELFGDGYADEDKKKRSVNEDVEATPSALAAHADVTTTAGAEMVKNDSEQMSVDTHGNEMHHQGKYIDGHGHTQSEHKHRKRSNHQHSHENDSREEDSDEHDDEEEDEEEDTEHDGEHDDEHEDFEGEDEEEERKRKRDTHSEKGENVEVAKKALNDIGNVSRARSKKSVQWSKYFGIDRKKKSQSANMKKRTVNDEDDLEDVDKKRSNLDPEKLNNMDRKLQSIEDYIIDDTVKYTGAHEGITSPAEIRRLKDHVLSRLATAYNLEKMRRALDKLRQSVDNENHIMRNVIESDETDVDKKSQKRLSVKKDNTADDAPLLSGNVEKQKEIQSNAMMSTTLGTHSKNHNGNDNGYDEDDTEDAKKKRQRKRNSYLRYPALPNNLNEFDDEFNPIQYEALNDAYLGNKNYIIGSNQCPLIESMAERCRGVDLLSGDFNQELLPACGVHQICYLCGTSQVACDYQYLAEADEICGNNNECQAAARSVLMILRGTPGTKLGPRACLKNPCLYSAMREIGL